MLKRLFGETVEGRKAFLKKRLIITGPMVLIGMILLLFGEESISSVLLVVAFYIWGWTMVKRLFGAAAVGSFWAFFTGHILLGCICVLAFIVLGYLFGMFGFVVGLIYFIYLLLSGREKK